MKIAIVQRENVLDIRTHSGVYFFMRQALEEHVGETIWIRDRFPSVTWLIEECGRFANRASGRLLGVHVDAAHSLTLSKHLGRVYTEALAQCGCDIVFAPNASPELAFLSTKLPIIYRTDMNWHNIVDYYPRMKSLFAFSKLHGELIEAAALQKAGAVIYPSQWAAATAIEHYGVPPSKVHCIPSGANLFSADIPSREEALRDRGRSPVRLLWVGVDWERKGGDVAARCLQVLLEKGVDAELIVVGCVPPERYLQPRMQIIPRLSKRREGDRKRLAKLMLESTFMVFPTKAEAFGVVICEASAHGLPVLARETGGVSGALVDGVNGFLLPPDAGGEQYADKILAIIADAGIMQQLVLTSRNLYEERLNWDAWGRAVQPIFAKLCNRMTL